MGSRTSSGTRWNRTRWRVASGVLTTAIAVIAVMAVRTAGSTDVRAVSAGTELNTAAPATSTTTSSTVAPTTVAPTVTSAPETTVATAIPQPTTPVTTPTTPKSGTPKTGTPKTGTPKVGSPNTPVVTSPPATTPTATTPTATAPPNRAPSVNTAYANPSSKTLSGNYAYWDIWLLNDAFVDADGDTWVLYSAGNGQYGTASITSCSQGGAHKCVRYQPSAANQGLCLEDQISVRAWDPSGSNNSSDVLRINLTVAC